MADEKLALVIELKALKDDFAALQEKAAADREVMEAEVDLSPIRFSIMATVVALSLTTYVGASLESRMGCRTLLFC